MVLIFLYTHDLLISMVGGLCSAAFRVAGEISPVLVCMQVILNSLFGAPFIEVEARRQKREYRITFMHMLRTNQSEARSVATLARTRAPGLKMLAQMTNSTTRPSARINASENCAKLHPKPIQ